MRHEPLGLREQTTSLDQTRANSLLHALDEGSVLGADLRVERERLLDPGVVGVRRDKVVEEAVRALGCQRDDRADREIRGPA